MSHASIFSNLPAVFTIVYRLMLRKPVHKFEFYGLIIATMGLVISVLDKNVQKVDSRNQHIFWGDISGIISSVAGCVYFNLNAKVVETIPPSISVFTTIVISEACLAVYGLLFDTFTLDANIETGLIGFFSEEYFIYCCLVLGLGCGTISLYCSALSLKYYPPIVLLIAYLLEPLIA